MATRRALNAFTATGENPINYIVRHMNLDPGRLELTTSCRTWRAVREGGRVFSAYELRDRTRTWIVIDADRFVTTILPPKES